MAVQQLTPFRINIGTNAIVELLDPTFFLGAGITKKSKIASIQGILTINGDTTYPACAAGGVTPYGASFAAGIYVDTGPGASTSADNALTQSYSLDWMWWKPGHIANSLVCAGANSPSQVADSFNWQRFYVQTRKYTRNIDPSDDSLVLSVANASVSTTTIALTYNLRILVLEP